MFFKNLAYLSLLGLSAWSMGCSLPLSETPAQSAPPQAKIDFEKKCLSDVLPIMERFIEGTATPAEIDDSWRCFSQGLDLFYRKVKGREENSYSSEELTRFFEDYFFDDLRLSDELRIEIMRIKQILVGGGEASVTREELRGLLQFAEVARQASVDVLPYMKYISFNWAIDPKLDIKAQIQSFNKSSQAFQQFIETIGGQIDKNQVEYRLSNLTNLLEEIGKLYGSSWSAVDKIRRFLPLIEDLKESLIGGQGSIIAADEWIKFSLMISRGYIQYLRYYYFIKDSPVELAEYDVLFLASAFDDLLSYLGDVVRNKPEGALTKAEILISVRSLKTIFPSLTVSETFIDQVLLLKRLFLGGTSEFVYAIEFDLGREKIGRLEDLGNRFYSFGAIYFLRWQASFPISEQDIRVLETAAREIDLIAQDLGEIFEADYDLKNLAILFDEITNLLNWDGVDRTNISDAKRFVPLIIAVKKAITASQSSIVKKDEWPKALKFLAGSFGDYLYLHYALGNSPSWRESIASHDILFARLMSRMRELLANHRYVIDPQYLYDIFTALVEGDVLGNKRDLSPIKRAINLLIQKIFWPAEKQLAGVPARGIEEEHLIAIQAGWEDFKIVHQWISHHLPSNMPVTKSTLASWIQGLPSPQKELVTRVWLEPSFNLISLQSGLVSFDMKKRGVFDKISLQNQNIWRLATRFIAQAYSGKVGLLDLSKARYDLLFQDLMPILRDLELVDPDNTTFSDNRFMEANLFTPSANGNKILEYAEGTELMQLLWSGLKRHELVLTEIENHCRPLNFGIKSKVAYDLNCWAEQSHKTLVGTYADLFDGLRVYQKLSPESFSRTWTSFLIGTGWIPNQENEVVTDDFSLVPHLVQYSESLINRFDLNHDQRLDREEALAAYPVFRETLKSAADYDSERMLKGGYAYILVHKKLPQTLGEKIGFVLSWINREDSWPIKVDRPGLAEVLRAIAAILRGEEPATIDLEELEPWLKNPPPHLIGLDGIFDQADKAASKK